MMKALLLALALLIGGPVKSAPKYVIQWRDQFGLQELPNPVRQDLCLLNSRDQGTTGGQGLSDR